MTTKNIQAKQHAINELDNVWVNPSSIVSYQSKGFVLIVSDTIEAAQSVVTQLNPDFTVHYLLGGKTNTVADKVTYGELSAVAGYLGSFEITALVDGKSTSLIANSKGKYFDIIIDLIGKVKIAPVPPFGYYVLSKNSQLFAEINQLMGTLDKPKFFNLDTTLCVHSRNKTQLCQRCINACPADAILSNGDYVDVSPNLCHGCGGCSSACPTGAISYAYPTIEDHSKKMHALANGYLMKGGKQAKLLFYTQDNEKLLPPLDDNILPLALEEIGYLGIETILYAFCLGAEQISIHAIDEPQKTLNVLTKQIDLSYKILQSLGYQPKKSSINLTENVLEIKQSIAAPLKHHIGLLDLANKRNRIFEIVDFLSYQQSKKHALQCDFSNTDDAYFGAVVIDKKLCTLCMACTSVCPPKALSSGNINKPIVNFQENLCVQCGLCAKSCPEDAIQLEGRLIFDSKQRNKQVVLNQDKPFKCSECGKVFGSEQVILKMVEKLVNHSMFADGKLENLKKCEDCRVKALF